MREERVVRLDGPLTAVDVPIDASHAPNVFAVVHIFKVEGKHPDVYGTGTSIPEGRLLRASAELVVPANDRRLTVTIAPDAPEYRPGGRATFTIQVADAAGAPAVAQVGLALVDEAIFALSQDLSADLFTTFYGARADSLITYDSLSPRRFFYRVVDAGPGPVPTPTGTPAPEPTAVPQPPSAGSGQENPRRVFLDTAYWNPSIRTGSDGRATVVVNLPDNLTTWRAVARAVTLDTAVGEARTNILVTQEIIARPALPRFTVRGDRFEVATLAQNYSGQDTTGTATLSAPGLVVLNPGPRPFSLPDRGTAVSRWTAVASATGSNPITCGVETGAGNDAVELPLRTVPFAVPERWTAAGQANPVAVERFTISFNAVPEASDLTVRLAPSIALGVLDGLDALIDYPYGCVEQTMSRVLPSAVAAQTYQRLGIPNPKAAELPEIIRQGLQKLYGFQHDTGGWGWWYDDSENLYLTAYVLFGLTMVGQAGFDVAPAVLERGFAFLDAQLAAERDPRVAAYALYVKSAAGRGNLAAERALLAQQEKLDPFARAALALALARDGDPAAAQALLDRLLAEVQETPTTAHWPPSTGGEPGYAWRTMSSAEKNTAMALRALAALRPDAADSASGQPLLPKVVRWLMARRRGAGWQDTQATAFAVLGLADTILISGEMDADYTYHVTLNGGEITGGRVTSATVTLPITPTVISGAGLRPGENVLRVERAGPGQLYYTLTLREKRFYDEFAAVGSLNQGLAVNRSYRLVQGTPRGKDIFDVGDLVEVRLDVAVRDEAWYVVLEDPLPAGFEALSERMSPIGYGDLLPPGLWRWGYWGYNRKDVYDDRVAFFMTQLWPGQHTFTYLMRATTPGVFGVLPAQAYPMYDETAWGRSASAQVRVSPETLAPQPGLAGDFDRDCRVTAFDTRQVAGAWWTTDHTRDVIWDGRVDLQDVAAVAGRQGAACLADLPAPGIGEGSVRFALAPAAAAVQVGETFSLTLSADNLAALGGFGLVLTFDPARLAALSATLSPALAESLPLGPRIDQAAGQIAFGAYGPPVRPSGDELATIAFVAQRAGPAEIRAERAQAADVQGRTLATAALDGIRVIAEGTDFLPMIFR